MQSTLPSQFNGGLHVAIIMDGNGRWAAQRNLPRSAGHKAGANTVRRIVQAAPGLAITTMTLYAFSSDNWRRPRVEVSALMRLLDRYLDRETRMLAEQGTRLSVIGRRDRLPAALLRRIEHTEAQTASGQRLHLRIALDYSARAAILDAACRLAGQATISAEQFSHALSGHAHCRDVDLLIRTSGEQRLSDFLLWECAYAEFYFTDRLWPDFGSDDLARAIAEFAGRDRRFGAVTTGTVTPAAGGPAPLACSQARLR